MKPFAFVFLLVFLSACDTVAVTDDVTLRTGAETFGPGDTVHLRLENESGALVGYNLCYAFLDLQQRDGESWTTLSVSLGPDDDTACTDVLRGLPPGTFARGEAHLPDDLEPNTYRIGHEVEIDDERHLITSNAFVVTE